MEEESEEPEGRVGGEEGEFGGFGDEEGMEAGDYGEGAQTGTTRTPVYKPTVEPQGAQGEGEIYLERQRPSRKRLNRQHNVKQRSALGQTGHRAVHHLALQYHLEKIAKLTAKENVLQSVEVGLKGGCPLFWWKYLYFFYF